MNEKELSKRIESLSINSRKFIINTIGLKKASREIMYAKYVDELTLKEMCEKFNYDERYINAKLLKAKKEMNKIIKREYNLMSDELREYIKLLIED